MCVTLARSRLFLPRTRRHFLRATATLFYYSWLPPRGNAFFFSSSWSTEEVCAG